MQACALNSSNPQCWCVIAVSLSASFNINAKATWQLPLQQTQGPRRVAVAMDPSVMLHQHGIIGLDSDLDSVIAQAA